MYKPTRLLDPGFKYIPAKSTNIAKTFARVRRELASATGASIARNVPSNKQRNPA